MADEKTRADSLRAYLSGAASDGAAQTDPDAALGDYRSSSETTYLDAVITNPITNITVDYISGGNLPGAGSLDTFSVNELTWTPPGGSVGSAVTILNGETKIMEGGGAPGEFVRVTRNDAVDMTGTASLALTYTLNDVVGFDDTSAAEAAAGDIEYRALFIKNDATAIIKNVTIYIKTLGTNQVSGSVQLSASGSGVITLSTGTYTDWPASGFCRVEEAGGSLREIVYYESRTSTTLTVPALGRAQLGTSEQAGSATDVVLAVPGVRLATEAPIADQIQTIANENTAPTGRTWVTAVTNATGIVIGDMATLALYGLWMERSVIVGATSEASVLQSFAIDYDAA